MRIDSQILALRGDLTSQRHLRTIAEKAHRAWSERPEVALVLSHLRRFGEGEALRDLPALCSLLQTGGTGDGFVRQWCQHFLAPLVEQPLVQIPFQHHHAAGYSTLRLAGSHGSNLSLVVYAEMAQPTSPRSCVFSDREQHELVLAGSAQAVRYHVLSEESGWAEIENVRMALNPGARIETIGCRSSRQIEQVQGRLLLLQLSRLPERPGLTREYALPSGELLMQSSGDKHASQLEMAMAVLGSMGRADAAETVAGLSRSGPDHLRWEAVRHVLALDTQRGIDLLSCIAARKADTLSQPASRLVAQLRQTYPQLAQVEESEQCPA